MPYALCGLHLPGTLPCRHCARAHAANEAALAHVQPRPASEVASKRLTDSDVSRIQGMHAFGLSIPAIALQERKGKDVIRRVIAGQYVTTTIARKNHGERALPVPGQYQRMAATPLPRSAR